MVFDGDMLELEDDFRGWILVFYLDLIRKLFLFVKIDGYLFFNYDVNEVFYLLEEELDMIEGLLDKIVKEYS